MSARESPSSHAMPRSAAKLFIRREYAAIRGRRASAFWALYAIVLCSLLAIVFGKAALAYLREKMDDPFTSMVSIPVLNARNEERYVPIKEYLDSCAAAHAFHMTASSGNHTTGWFFFSPRSNEDYYTYAFSFSFHHDHALLEKIIGPGNLVADLSGGRLNDPTAYRDGLIISLPLLEELGLDSSAIRGRKLLAREGPYTFALPVLAIVRTLPERSKVYCEHSLLRGIDNKDAEGTIPTDDVQDIAVLLNATAEDIPAEEHAWAEALRKVVPEAERIDFRADATTATHGVLAKIALRTRMPLQEGPLFYQDRLNENGGPLAASEPRLVWEARFKDPRIGPALGGGENGQDRFTNLTASFSSLDAIGEFQRDIFQRAHVELDLDRVESQKNFAVVSGLGGALIAALLLFAVLAIVLFLHNTLKNHLERIQMNLGTFLAFGIPERFLISGYLRIIFMLVLRVSTLAMATLLFAHLVIIALGRSGARIPGMLAHVKVLGNAWLYLALALMFCACYAIVHSQLRKFLARPPGDLIYART